MSLNMYFFIGSNKYSLDLPYEVMDVTKILVESGYEEPIEIIFGNSKEVDREKLIEAIQFLIDSFENELDILPDIFYIKYERPRGSDNFVIGAGYSTGVIIDGSRYKVEGGVDKCQLTKSWQDEVGVWHEDEPIDIRDKNIVKTDLDGDRGDLEIIRTKKPFNYIDRLIELRELLINAKEITVVKKIHPFD